MSSGNQQSNNPAGAGAVTPAASAEPQFTGPILVIWRCDLRGHWTKIGTFGSEAKADTIAKALLPSSSRVNIVRFCGQVYRSFNGAKANAEPSR